MKRSRGLMIPATLVFLLAFTVSIPARAARDEAPKKDAILATINGEPVTEAEVSATVGDQLKNLEREYKRNRGAMLESALQSAIENRMLQAEAKVRNLSADALLATIKPAPVTDAAVDTFYEQNKAQIPSPKEQVVPQIRAYLEQQAQQKAREGFFRVLETKYKVDMKLQPVREQVAAKGPARGTASAPITIIEFSDFQCPFCARVNPTFDQVRAKYGDKVRFVFRQFPLPNHQFAQKAAEASLCADDQGKFWELHDAMFANQQALGVDQLKAKAVQLGMNAALFNSCLDTGKKAAAVETDKREGEAVGVNGTPGIFVNGRFLNGSVPLEQISSVIDDELRRAGGTKDGEKKARRQ